MTIESSGGPAAAQADHAAACEAMARTGPEHELIARFAGTFRAEVRMWMQPGAEPVVSSGTMINTMILGDRFLEHRYTDDSGAFEGRGLWGFNTVDRRHEGLWVDSMATFFQSDTGRRDESTGAWEMVGHMTDPTSGAPLRKRSVVSLVDDDHHSMETYFSPAEGPDAGREFKSMEIRFTRA